MSTVVITTTITGKINGRSVNIPLITTINDVVYTMERNGRVPIDGTMASLEGDTEPPAIDNAQLCYLHLDTLAGSGDGKQLVYTASSDIIELHTSPGDGVDFFRSDAGGIVAMDVSGTVSVLEDVGYVEQTALLTSTNAGFFAAFKPLS